MTTTAKDWRTMAAGRELDALVAERFDLPTHVTYEASYNGGESSMFGSRFRGEVEAFIADYQRRMPDSDPARCEVVEFRHYQRVSTDMAAAWQVVVEVQRRYPGWRFDLLGGDTSFVMVRGNSGVRVDRTRRETFGWRASFFGHEDPERNYGQRHADERADTPALACCRGALAATEAR